MLHELTPDHEGKIIVRSARRDGDRLKLAACHLALMVALWYLPALALWMWPLGQAFAPAAQVVANLLALAVFLHAVFVWFSWQSIVVAVSEQSLAIITSDEDFSWDAAAVDELKMNKDLLDRLAGTDTVTLGCQGRTVRVKHIANGEKVYGTIEMARILAQKNASARAEEHQPDSVQD